MPRLQAGRRPGLRQSRRQPRQGEREGFLAQHRHTRLQAADRPFGVQVVGQTDVDRVDCARVEHGLVAVESLWNFPFGRVRVGRVLAAAGDGDELPALRGAESRDDAAVDVSGGDQSPADFGHDTSKTTEHSVKLILAWCHPEARRRVPALQDGDPSPSLRVTLRRNLVYRVVSDQAFGQKHGIQAIKQCVGAG